MSKPSHRQLLIGATLTVVALMVAAGLIVWLYRDQLPPVDEVRGMAIQFLEAIPAWAYFLAFIILPALGVPLTLFYLTALPVLGSTHPAIGVVLAWTAVALNMILAHFLARGILHPAIEWILRRRHLEIPRIQPQNEWRIVLTVRLSPVPYCLQNFILSLGRARWRSYLGLSILIQGSIGLGVMIVGESIFSGGLTYALLALFALFALHLLFEYIRKRLTRDNTQSD